MSRTLLMVVYCLFSLPTIAQQKTRYSATVAFQYHPYDFFLSAGVEMHCSSWHHEVQLGCGVNRTFFQQRFYPKVTYSLGYRLMDSDTLSWKLIPQVRLALSSLNVQPYTTHSYSKWVETFAGLKIGYGRRSVFGLAAGLGPSWEFTYDESAMRNRIFRNWNYYFEINYAVRLRS